MRNVPAALQAHLDSGATTLAWCWRLTRADGVRQGFTDHDKDLVFDGTRFEAAAGFTGSEIKDGVGLAVDSLEVSGALSSAALEEADLAAGIYDDARVEIFRVNWQDSAQRLLIHTGCLGEVRRAGGHFTAEVRGLAHYLQQPKGRLLQYTCDADLGDARCRVDVVGRYMASGSIVTADSARRFAATGLDALAHDWLTRGLLTFTSGAAHGQQVEVKSHSVSGGVVRIELWSAARLPLEAGQTFQVTAGCDKLLATCRGKFANASNFRGFPTMPGNDFLARRGGAR